MKKNILLAASIILLSAHALLAQVSLNFESGNIAVETGNCWKFEKVTYTNSSSSVLTGTWSGKTDQLNSSSITNCWIKSPWILPVNGNITFTTKFDGTNGNSRGVVVYYIPYLATNAPTYEGTPVQFYTYTFPQPYSTVTPTQFSIPIPGNIVTSTDLFKFRVSFIGDGGSTRLITDDFIFPGAYYSDPANNCNAQVVILDEDGDGVADAEDAYPTDQYRAYNSYFPSEYQSGTLAFEDLWPAKGDFDYNDVVVDYRMQTVTNADNNVVEVYAKIVLRAIGASFKNGFGFQIDGIPSNKITSVSGNSVGHTPIYSFAPNGLEADQTYATCIVFDNFYKVMSWPGGGAGINTVKTTPSSFTPYVTLNVHLVFINNGTPAPGGTVSGTELTSDRFNFFIVGETWTGEMINDSVRVTVQDRGKEIHLADRMPTDLVNDNLFGTLDDDTQISSNKYYKTANNLPWGINILQGFDYPIEKASIDTAYLHFIEWAVSGGIDYPDWFYDSPGYRNAEKIY